MEKNADPKYTLTDHLWKYLQDYAEHHRQKGNGFGFGLVDLDGVSRTLSARYYKDGSEIALIPQKGKNPRRLTPLECQRLMGFDEKPIVVSDTQAYRQFGNAVVPKVAYAVGQQVLAVLRWQLTFAPRMAACSRPPKPASEIWQVRQPNAQSPKSEPCWPRHPANSFRQTMSVSPADISGAITLPKPVWKMFTKYPPARGRNDETAVQVQWQDGQVTDSRVKWYGAAKSEYRLTRFGVGFPFITHDCVGNLLVLIPEDYTHFLAFVLDLEDDIEEIQAALDAADNAVMGCLPP